MLSPQRHCHTPRLAVLYIYTPLQFELCNSSDGNYKTRASHNQLYCLLWHKSETFTTMSSVECTVVQEAWELNRTYLSDDSVAGLRHGVVIVCVVCVVSVSVIAVSGLLLRPQFHCGHSSRPIKRSAAPLSAVSNSGTAVSNRACRHISSGSG